MQPQLLNGVVQHLTHAADVPVHAATWRQPHTTTALRWQPSNNRSSPKHILHSCQSRAVGQGGMPQQKQAEQLLQPQEQQQLGASIVEAGGMPMGKRRKRTAAYPWTCPACGNKFPLGVKLVDHMAGCCADLLAAYRQQPQQQQCDIQNRAAAAAAAQAGGHAAAGLPWADAELQQLVAAAADQEQALRMRVLRLLHVADPGAGVAPVQPSEVAAATTGDDDDGLDDSSSDGTAAAAPGDNSCGSAAEAAGGAAAGDRAHSQNNKHCRQPRAPLRTPQQLMDILQLPRNRVANLIARAPRSIQLVADTQPLQVVYEDAAFLAVLKPPGLRSAPVHRFMGGSALNRMIGYLGYEPHLLHRLDMNTSGVLLAAKDRAAAAAAHAQFRDKTVSKAYLALALGVPQQRSFTVDGAIGHHPAVKVARRVVAGGQQAVTHIQVLATNTHVRLQPQNQPTDAAAAAGNRPLSIQQDSSSNGPCCGDSSSSSSNSVPAVWGCAAPELGSISEGCCLLCCRPVTGRTHQIRVHCAHAGHPLLGDEVYGLQGPWIGRQALHAWSLTLKHPSTGQPVTFTAPPPSDFAAAAAALGLQLPQQA